MTRRTRRTNDYILPAWVGPVVSGDAVPYGAQAQWHTCPKCKRQMLTLAPRLCMSCDPEYIQIQPGVFSKRSPS